jgi:DNA-binding beta-propeller fold protein YncE
VSLAAPSGSWAKDSPAGYHVSKRIALPGTVSYYDYLTYDEGTRRLFVSHGDEVVVVDPESGQVTTRLTGFKKVHGIAVTANRAFVTDGGTNLVRAFDLKSWKLVGEAESGKNPDAITYDPASRLIVAVNHSGSSVTAIDPATVKVSATVDVGGKAESAQADGKGLVWVNVEDKNEIVQIDSRKKAVTARWSIAPCKTPTGLGFDPKNRRLFAGCEENKMMVVVDADNGKVITHLPIGDRVDGTHYDAKTGNIFNACGDGTLTVIHQDGPDQYSVLQNVETMKGAKTLSMDRLKNRVFLSAKAPAAAGGGSGAAPPGSLVVLVVEQ